MKIKILRIGLITLLASLLVIILLVGKFGVNVKKPLLTAASCAGRCATNCNDDETGQGLGTGGCPSDKHNCVPNVCNGVPDAGTSCVNAGFVCVARGTCPAGHNQAGSCNTANTDCCDTASGDLPPDAQPASSCIFDNYQHRGCVQVNGTWMMCDKDPKGEVGFSNSSCQNTVTEQGSAGITPDQGCDAAHPNCVSGGYCIGATYCLPSVAQYANCVSDSSCFPANPPDNPTPTPTPTHTPTSTPTPTTTPTSTPTSTPTYTPTATPTSTPNSCNGTCGSNSNCQSGYFCYNGSCRNPSCQDESDCSCGSTPTPTPTAPPVLGASTPPNLPKTGSNLLVTIAGLLSTIGVGVFFFKKFKLI